MMAKQAMQQGLISLMKKLSYLYYPKPSLVCYLFDMLIKPVMDYDSVVWSFAFTDSNDSLEIMHHKFCKITVLWGNQQMLYINLAVYGEFGRTPLST